MTQFAVIEGGNAAQHAYEIVEGLSKESAPGQISQAIRDVAALGLSEIEADMIQKSIKRATGLGIQTIRATFNNATPRREGEVEDGDYSGLLTFNDKGIPHANEHNVSVVLRHDSRLSDVIAYNEFAFSAWMKKPAPWAIEADRNRAWVDTDDTALACWIQGEVGINADTGTVRRSVEMVARDDTFHPVRDYLDGVTWDGTERITTWLSTYLGAEDTRFSRAVARAFLISAVARVMEPGAKVDTMLILEGDQGLRKSTAAAHLFGPDFYTDEIDDLGSKDAKMQVAGVWGIEMAELESMSKSEANKAKAFVSRRRDRFRAPYGARLIEVPRQSVFIGTSNDTHYLQDSTGGRRYWPIACQPVTASGQVDAPGIKQDRDQLWAEAVAAYRNGEIWWLEDADTVAEAKEAQEARYAVDPWEEQIAAWIEAVDHQDNPMVSTNRILSDALEIPEAQRTSANARRVGKIMTRLGYKETRRRINRRNVRGYLLG